LVNSSPTNIDSIEIQMQNGFKDRFDARELPALFRGVYSAAADYGQFSAGADIAWIDNSDGWISNATIYTNATGSSTVTVGRI
jgi:hypothetical protein